MLVKIYDAISDALDHIEWCEMKRRSLDGVRRLRYEEGHGRIVEAVTSRDATALREALADHLNAVGYNMPNP